MNEITGPGSQAYDKLAPKDMARMGGIKPSPKEKSDNPPKLSCVRKTISSRATNFHSSILISGPLHMSLLYNYLF